MSPHVLRAARFAPVFLASSALVLGTLGLATPAQAATGDTAVSGIVTDSSGKPLAGIPVELDNHQGFINSVSTGEDGSYKFNHLEEIADLGDPDDFTLDVNDNEGEDTHYLSVQTDGFTVEQDADVTQDVSLADAPTYTVSGKVFETGGVVPLGGVSVVVTNEETNESYTDTTAADGSYSIDGNLAGPYYDITANEDHAKPGYASNSDYFEIDGADFDNENLELAASSNAVGTVTGTVKDEADDTVADIPVRVLDEDGYLVADGATDGQGVYTIDDVDPGTYTVEANVGTASYDADETLASKDYEGVVVTANRQITQNVSLLTAITCASNPTVTGTPQVGQTLTSAGGTFAHAGDSQVSTSYEWYFSGGEYGGSIDGATTRSYTVTAADAGLGLGFIITASTPDRGTAYCSSPLLRVPAAAPVIAPGTPVPGAAAPAVTGKVKKGKKISSGISVPSGATASYQWYRTFKNKKHKTVTVAIPGATGAEYKLKGKDVGDKVYVVVTYSSPGYAATTLSSTPKKVKG